MEKDKLTLSSSPTYPQTGHLMNLNRRNQESAEIHHFETYEGNHNFNDKSNIGPIQSQANPQRKQRDQEDQIIPNEDYPYTTRYRERLQAKASRQTRNPMPPIGTPAKQRQADKSETQCHPLVPQQRPWDPEPRPPKRSVSHNDQRKLDLLSDSQALKEAEHTTYIGARQIYKNA